MASKKYGYMATIGANTSGLTAALADIERESKSVSNELKEINNALKLDPANTELLTQKYGALNRQLDLANTKTQSLEKISADVKKAFENNAAFEQEYEPLGRQIDEVKSKLKELKSEKEKLDKVLSEGGQIDQGQYDKYTQEIKEAEKAQRALSKQTKELEEKFKEMGGHIDVNGYRQYKREIGTAQAESANLKSEIQKVNSSLNGQEKALDNAEKSVKNYDHSLDSANNTTVKFSDLVKANALGDLIADSFRRAGSAVGDFIKQGITLASDLTEVQNVVDVTFGDGAEQIYAWADAAAESFGMSSLSAQEYNGTMGAMLKSMGLTDDKVKEMSMDMVGLAGDMASFYNLDVEKAFEKIRSGISGETEPLKQLGINMSVANLEAYALSQGIETAYKNMSEAEKATLRYNYLMSVTADAQGDFARTSDSFANQQRILQLQTENLAASFGEKLLPKINDLTGTLNENMPSIGENIDGVSDIVVGLFEFVIDHHKAILSVITGIGTALAAQKGAKVIGDVTGAVKNLFSTVKEGQGVMSALAASLNTQPWVLAVGAIAAVTAGIVALVKAASDTTVLKEKAEESTKAYEEQTEKVAGLEKELDDINTKISEIQSKGKLNFTDAQELANLQVQNDKLFAQLEIEKEILEIKRQQAAIDLNKAVTSEDSTQEGTVANVEWLIGEYEQALSDIEYWQDELDRAIARGDEKRAGEARKTIENFEQGAREYKLQILEETAALNELAENLDRTSETERETGAAIDDLNKKVTDMFGIVPTETVQDRIEEEETYAQYKQREGERLLAAEETQNAEALADYEEKLQNYVDVLDANLALRKIDEDKYYEFLENRLAANVNKESKLYYKQLERVEAYNKKRSDAADKAAKDEEKAEKERQDAVTEAQKKAEEERVKAIKASWDKITRMRERGGGELTRRTNTS